MNIKTTLVLLVLLAIVGGAFFYIKQGGGTAPGFPTPGAGDGSPVFDKLQPQRISRITLTRDGQTAELSREGSEWYQVSPVYFRLSDQAGPADIVEAVATLAYLDRFTPGAAGKPDLATVGLSPAYATLTVYAPAIGLDPAGTTNEGSTHTVRLSSRPVGGAGYAQIDDDPRVYVVKDTLHNTALGRQARDWRARTLPVPEPVQVSAVEVTHGGTIARLHKVDNTWYLNDAKDERADSQAVAALIDAVKAIYIMDFSADAPASLAPFGLDAARATIAITTPGIDQQPDTTRIIRVGGAADMQDQSFYANWSQQRGEQTLGGDVIFSIRASAAAALQPSIDGLRDPQLTTLKPHEIRAIQIKRPSGEKLHLLQSGSALAFAEPAPPYPPDRGAWRQLLDAITKSGAIGYLPNYEPTEPVATVTLNPGSDSRQTDAFTLYAGEDNEHLVAVRDGESIGYMVRQSALSPLFGSALTFRNRTLLEINPDNLRSISLKRPDGTFNFERGAEDVWQLNGSPAYDQPNFEALRNELVSLSASRWLDQAGDPAREIELTLTLNSGQTHTLSVNAETGEGTLTELDHTFILPDRMRDILASEFRHRAVITLAADQISRLTVTDGEQSLPITQQHGVFRSEGATIDQQAAAGLFDTVAGLHAERFHHVDAVALDPAAPVRVLLIESRDAERTLKLWPRESNHRNKPMARLGDSPYLFELREADAARLNAALTQ